MPRTDPRHAPLALLTLAALVFGGCASSNSGDVTEAEARRQRLAAENSRAVPVQMFLTVSAPRDSDGDRYADTFPLTIYLFPQPEWSAYRTPEYGHLNVEVTDDRLVGRYILRNGKVGDTFTIGREANAAAADAAAGAAAAQPAVPDAGA